MQAIDLGHTGIFGVLILFGVFQGYALATVFLLRGRGDRVANRLLALLILLITLHLTEIFMDVTGMLARFAHLSAATFPLLFLIGPAFYLYLLRLSGTRFRVRWHWVLHLIPAALCVSVVLPWYQAPLAAKIAYHTSKTWGGHAELDLATYLLLFVNVLQNIGYAFFAERLLKRREGVIARYVADNSVLYSLRALRKIARAFSAYAAGYLLLFAALLVWGKYSAEVDTVWLVMIALFWQVLGYSAIDQPEMFAEVLRTQGDEEASDEEVSGEEPDSDAPTRSIDITPDEAPAKSEPRSASSSPAKYAKAALTAEQSRDIMRNVRRVMEKDRLYLDGELKLLDVARALTVSQHNLSQAINRESEGTFLELVNRYRVEEAKRILEDPASDHLTVLAVAFDAGFNNKASFNQAFKKYTAWTPSAWRKARGAERSA